MDDVQALIDLNSKINDAENGGDREWLTGVLAPKFAFQRSDPARTVDDREAFLQKIGKAQPGASRQLRRVGPIHLYGERAVVEVSIVVGNEEFHNLRVFVKRDGEWKFLAWANEPWGKFTANAESRPLPLSPSPSR